MRKITIKESDIFETKKVRKQLQDKLTRNFNLKPEGWVRKNIVLTDRIESMVNEKLKKKNVCIW